MKTKKSKNRLIHTNIFKKGQFGFLILLSLSLILMLALHYHVLTKNTYAQEDGENDEGYIVVNGDSTPESGTWEEAARGQFFPMNGNGIRSVEDGMSWDANTTSYNFFSEGKWYRFE